MQRIAAAAIMAWLGVAVAAPGAAAPLQQDAGVRTPTDVSAQSRPQRRARPQLRVTPRYPYRSYHTFYPPPYDFEYPGPNAVRQCVGGYVTEHRPSGTVVVPRLRCWWVPG
jgi:hypothetical protein